MVDRIRVAELFAGVGGFRLGLEGYEGGPRGSFDLPAAGPFQTVWANQWEPGTTARQFAARCYEAHWNDGTLVNDDIHAVLDEYERGDRDIPDVDMVVGGFPCQDYSVARSLNQAAGIEGKKGVLWWDIYHFLKIQISKSPENARWCMFENVDRLLKSPAGQRGRDFAIILSCLSALGYSVEWRVVNSADYGFPQRRKRVYIVCERNADWTIETRLQDGVMSRAFPFAEASERSEFEIPSDPVAASEGFGVGDKVSRFMDAGVMTGCRVITVKPEARYEGHRRFLRDVLVGDDLVPDAYWIDDSELGQWEYLKGAKKEPRVNKRTGFEYFYSEGQMAFPDSVDKPSRTILTGEGGRGASRFKHVIQTEDGRYRRLVPDELDQLQCFPRGWTDTGMTDGQRAFCMGNALVVGVPHEIGKVISQMQ